MQAGEYECLSTVLFDFIVEFADDSAFFEIFVPEKIVAYEQSLHCLHFDASEDFFLPIGYSVLVFLHDVIEIL